MTDELYRFAAFMVAIVTSLIVFAIVILPAFFMKDGWRNKIAKDHPVTIAGVPIAGCSAFVVIAFYGAVAGPIKLNLWGLQIEGAGGLGPQALRAWFAKYNIAFRKPVPAFGIMLRACLSSFKVRSFAH